MNVDDAVVLPAGFVTIRLAAPAVLAGVVAEIDMLDAVNVAVVPPNVTPLVVPRL